jgi:hypothetical protein
MVETRDGTKLHTRVVLPRTISDDEKVPALIVRSPYGYGDMEQYGAIYSIFGFAAVGQDWRGTGKSEGHFSDFQLEGQDGYDLVSWIQDQDWANGEIYTFGASADGMASLLLLHDIGNNRDTIRREKTRASENRTTVENSINGQLFMLTTGESYPIFYPGGAYRHGLIDNWVSDTVRPEDQKNATDLLRAHETYDNWWLNIDMDDYYSLVKWPTTFYAGWYDIFLTGNIATFENFQKLSDPSVQGRHNLVIDPCGHCQEADEFFDQNLLYGRTVLAIFQNFQQFGFIPGNPRDPKKITFYVMRPYNITTITSNGKEGDESDDAPGNYFTTMDEWPEYTPTDFYLSSFSNSKDEDIDRNKKEKNIYIDNNEERRNNAYELHTDLSSLKKEDTTLTYTNDPTNPSPTIGGNNYMIHPCGPHDQSPLDSRSDVISFSTSILDAPLAITGPLSAQLFISSTAKDTDMTVRLTDYNPQTGQAQLIQDGIVRMRNRDVSNPSQQLLSPDEVYQADISLWNTSYIFPKGHQIKVYIASTNFPRFSTNNQTGVDIADEYEDATYVIANNTLYISDNYPSKIVLPVLKDYKTQLPEFKAVDYAEELAESIYNKFPHIKKDLKWSWDDLVGEFSKLEKRLKTFANKH